MDIISEISKGKTGKSYQQGTELLVAAGTALKWHLTAERQTGVRLKPRKTRL